MKFGTIDISNISVLILMSKIIFIKYLPSVRSKLVPKLKVLRIYWNLAHSIFQICQSQFVMLKMIFTKYLPPVRPKLVPNLKMLRVYWNLGTFDISNVPISIIMSKTIFIKHVLLVQPKLIPNLKVLNSIFQLCQCGFCCQKWFFKKHLLGQINSKIKIALKFMFDVSSVAILTMRSNKSFIEYLTTCYAKIGLQFWIPISIIKCKVIFMKYTQVSSIIILKSL